MKRHPRQVRTIVSIIAIAVSAFIVFSALVPAARAISQPSIAAGELGSNPRTWDEPELQVDDSGEAFQDDLSARPVDGYTNEEILDAAQRGDGATLLSLQGERGMTGLAADGSRAGADISDKVDAVAKVWIDGKEYQGGDVQTTVGKGFSYRFEWNLASSGIGALHEGDHFSKSVFMVPGLNLSNKNVALVVSGVMIGESKLDYDAKTGKMTFSVTFNDYAGFYDPASILGGMKGSGAFNVEVGGSSIEVGSNSGVIIVSPRPVVPQPERPVVPSGVVWKPTLPNESVKATAPFGKGIKWVDDSGDGPLGLPRFEWRIMFFDEIYKKQEAFAADAGLGENLKVDFYNGNCIVTDTLDANQQFGGLEGDALHKGAPFFLEIPVVVPGTNEVLNEGNWSGRPDGNGHFNHCMIPGGDLTKVEAAGRPAAEVIREVKKKPLSWAVTKDSATARETLTINVGVLGAKTGENAKGINMGMTKAVGHTRWAGFDGGELRALKTIDESWRNAHNLTTVQGYGADSSPFVKLSAAARTFDGWFTKQNFADAKHGNTQEQVDAAMSAYADFKGKFDAWVVQSESNAARGYRDVKLSAGVADAWSTALTAISQLKLDGGAPITTRNDLANLAKSLEKFNEVQKVYDRDLESYIKVWAKRADDLKRTYNFYRDGQVFGFNVKVASTVTNPSATTFSNDASVAMGDTEYSTSGFTKATFSNYVQGSYAVGSIVMQKAEGFWDTSADDQQDIEAVEKADAGLAGAKFKVYAKEGAGAQGAPELTDANLAWFFDRAMSVNKDSYAFIHLGPNHTSAPNHPSTSPVKGETSELVSDAQGRIVLGNIKNDLTYWLVETEPPAGCYLDTTPVPVTGDSGKVVYGMISNDVRAVQIKKTSSYNGKPVSGAEFGLFKADGTPVTGFKKASRSISTPDGEKTTYYYLKDEKGTDKLLTRAGGELNIHGLDAGSYYLQEIAPASGYVGAGKSARKYEFELERSLPADVRRDEFGFYRVRVDADAKTPQIDSVENTPMASKRGIVINKMNKGGEPIAGAKFALFEWQGTQKEFEQDRDNPKMWKPVAFSAEGRSLLTTPNVVHRAFKVDEAANHLIAGKTFDAVETGANGQIAFRDIPIGHYRMTEVEAASGYVRNNLTYGFNVSLDKSGKGVEVSKLYTFTENGTSDTFNNNIYNYRRPARFMLLKYDESKAAASNTVDGQKINDGPSWSERKDGWYYEGAKINHVGGVRAGGLAGVEYELYQQDGYEPNPRIDRKIGAGTTNAEGILRLPRFKDEAGAGIISLEPGVLVELDDNGVHLAGLHPDNYYLVEVKAPKGFIVDPAPIRFALDRHSVPGTPAGMLDAHDGTPVTPGIVKRVSNKPYQHAIHIVKRDAQTGAPLAGAEFALDWIARDGTKLADIKVREVKPGEYAPVKNPQQGSDVLRADENGNLVIVNLRPELFYSLTETRAPEGYAVPADPVTRFFVTSDPGDKNLIEGQAVKSEGGRVGVHADIGNVRIPARAVARKVDAVTGGPVKGAEFELYQVIKTDDGFVDKYIATSASGEDGSVVFDGLTGWGQEYYIKEVSAPAGYKVDGTPHRFVLPDQGGAEVEVKGDAAGGAIGNVYTAQGELVINAAKRLENRSDNSSIKLPAGAFQFKIEQVKLGQDGSAPGDARLVGEPVSNEEGASCGAAEFEARVPFAPIRYTVEGLLADAESGFAREAVLDGKRVWKLRYRVSEDAATLPEGYKVEVGCFDLSVEVTDQGDGTLSARVVGEGADGLVFKNSYSEKPEPVVPGPDPKPEPGPGPGEGSGGDPRPDGGNDGQEQDSTAHAEKPTPAKPALPGTGDRAGGAIAVGIAGVCLIVLGVLALWKRKK